MNEAIEKYWMKKLEHTKENLISNNFNVFIAENEKDASKIFFDQIMTDLSPVSVSWGGSLTFKESGIYEKLKKQDNITIIDTYDKSFSKDEIMELRRNALLCDLFITGTNAVTETGVLINLDMIGNRVGAITFGPKNVVILAGRNKIVPDIDSGVQRIKNYSAPVNAIRLDKKTPCAKVSTCSDCSSPDRICNVWAITEKSFPEKRISIILINKDLGF
ncbi:MAG: lactate utilization protein [Desulfobacteraceae bacterium]|nr:lactate utilization protein [Desulfobacteraceae bacterium]